MSVDLCSIAFIGLGEAASAIIAGWGSHRNKQVQAYDIKLQESETREEIISRAGKLDIVFKSSLRELIKDADLIFSTVTASQALNVAQEASSFLKDRAYFFDLNSCAPSSKQESSKSIETNGGYYLDVAVMAPVFTKKHLVPLLISGDKASQAIATLNQLPMNAKVISVNVNIGDSVNEGDVIFVVEAMKMEVEVKAASSGKISTIDAKAGDQAR